MTTVKRVVMHKFAVLKSISVLILVQSLFSSSSLYADPIIGLFFSPASFTENGFFILGIEISHSPSTPTFLAQELRYHKEKGWEEVIFSGKVTSDTDEFHLRPNSCQVRANQNFGEKMGLVRRFDCTHLDFVVSREKDGRMKISSSLLGTKSPVILDHWLPKITGEPIAISFLLPGLEREEGVWGFHLNGIGKTNPVEIWNPKTRNWERFRKFESVSTLGEYNIYRWKRTFSD